MLIISTISTAVLGLKEWKFGYIYRVYRVKINDIMVTEPNHARFCYYSKDTFLFRGVPQGSVLGSVPAY